MKYSNFAISPLLLILSTQVWAEVETEHKQNLEEVTVVGKRQPTAQPFTGNRKASDMLISGEKLKSRSATLGNALAGELGIHSNPFGGGASAPVIRGQEGVRVKILQNGSDVVDMSSLSPDHAVAADTLLAQRVEVLRGTSTLAYAAASPAGVVNIADKRIPTSVPEKGYEGETAVRFDTAAKEKAATAVVTFGLGDNIAVHAEGLTRHSDNYRVRGINLGETLKYVPDTHNKSHVGTLGLSWVGSKGHLGASYTYRKDRYGLPGHNHMLDRCSGHIFDVTTASPIARTYLLPYPHLMADEDVNDSHHFHCDSEHNQNKKHSHDNVYGHKHDHSGPGPWVDMNVKRYELAGEWKQPFAGLSKIKFSSVYSNYYHDEKNDGKVYISPDDPEDYKKRKLRDGMEQQGKPDAIFANRGLNTRLEFFHTPIAGFNGMAGIQYQTQKSSARRVAPPLKHGERYINERNPLVENTNKQLSLFALEQYRIGNVLLEGGVRWEKQRIPIRYDQELLARYVKPGTQQPDLSAYSEKAFSYSGGLLWDFAPYYRLSLTASHNERLPTPMELYYHGKHLATNSFEFGNKGLRKERSNNVEIGLSYSGEKWDYKISAYRNRFKNFIHAENLHRSGNLFVRRYIQSQARFHGLEGEIGYQFTPRHKFTVFGDIVRGKLFGLPILYGDKIYREYTCVDEDGLEDTCFDVVGRETAQRPDRYAPRVPPARLGFRLNSEFNEKWSTSLEYTRVFNQNRTAVSEFPRKFDDDELEENGAKQRLYTIPVLEDPTRGYHLLNAGIAYRNRVGKTEYKVSLDMNNLLNQKVYIHNSHLPYVPQPGRNFIFGVNVKF
ncbi:TonB-dependent receptor protein [Neisseria zoodegmatis]|uniref:TonB-dependent receptor protein n=1 Tax=Neisseria zoodegmatis TaxID=326523 RepID=A0A378WUE4_9NEIS|nr:TonB-dependent receptor [Neisseria zoodegmatis]SUA44111.1 TonB-dependent receptor protein [Neisseria zoodegmatis]